jgi:hypothetical protein
VKRHCLRVEFMEGNGMESLYESKSTVFHGHEITANPKMIGTSRLDIGGDPPHVVQHTEYNDEAPPAPQLNSKGVVATDITRHFIKATQGVYLPQA